jgi:Carboxypeptidase regulatory-like domain
MKPQKLLFRILPFALALFLLAGCPGSGGQNTNTTAPGPSPAANTNQQTSTGAIQGTVTGLEGEPLQGVTVSLDGTDRTAVSGADGGFKFEGVAAGKASLSVERTLTAEGDTRAQPPKETIKIEGVVAVEVSPNGTVVVKIKLTIQIGGPAAPPCNATPWCGIIGGTVNGRLRVVAGGGKSPQNSPAPVTIKITDPNGNVINPPQPPGRQTFDPAAPGVWKVEVTVCGKTKTCQINL